MTSEVDELPVQLYGTSSTHWINAAAFVAVATRVSVRRAIPRIAR